MSYIYEIEHKEGGRSITITIEAQNSEEAINKAIECHTNTGCFSIKKIDEIIFSYSPTRTKTDKHN